MVEPQPSKLMTWVRLPSPAPRVASVEARAVGGRVAFAGRGRGRNLSAHVAQSVEHFLGKEEVTGSNPVMGSSFQH